MPDLNAWCFVNMCAMYVCSYKGQRPGIEPLLGIHTQIHSFTSAVHAHYGQVHCTRETSKASSQLEKNTGIQLHKEAASHQPRSPSSHDRKSRCSKQRWRTASWKPSSHAPQMLRERGIVADEHGITTFTLGTCMYACIAVSIRTLTTPKSGTMWSVKHETGLLHAGYRATWAFMCLHVRLI